MKQISGNALVVKEVNTHLVRKTLKGLDKATKQQIAEATGLSIVTVNTVFKQLIKNGEVIEAEMSLSKGGRPAQLFKYNADYAFGLILYTYEKNRLIYIHTTVVNLFGKHIAESDTNVGKVDLESLGSIIDKYILLYSGIKAIGLGLPGTEYDGKMIVSDYKELLGVSIIDYFTARYQMPVIVENDVNAAVIGLAKQMAADNEETIVYIFFPGNHTPGAGIFINGKLYRGKRNFAGEVSNIPFGIEWTDTKLYTLFDEICDAIAKLVVGISSVINPDIVILHGHFLSEQHQQLISKKCFKELPPSAVPEILLSETFIDDFLSGMIVRTLETLEPGIVVTRI